MDKQILKQVILENQQEIASRPLFNRQYVMEETMLSSEFMTTLGGRFLERDVYPFSFREVMEFTKTPYNEHTLLTTKGRANVIKASASTTSWIMALCA